MSPDFNDAAAAAAAATLDELELLRQVLQQSTATSYTVAVTF